MEFTVSRADLVRELNLSQGVVEKKTTIPILSNVLLEADGERVHLTATDLELGIRCSCPARVKKSGSGTIPARRLLDYIRLLPEGDVQVKIQENHWASMTSGRSRTRIAGMSRDSFPELPQMPPVLAEIPFGVLSSMIAKTVFSISSEESRFTMNGALLVLRKGGVIMVATDGHRMAMIESSGEIEGITAAYRALLPRKAMLELQKLAGESDPASLVRFAGDENHLFFQLGDRLMLSRKLTGNFPDWERVLPREQPNSVTLVRDELRGALERVAQFADDRSRSVRVRVAPDEVKVHAATAEMGEAEETIPATYAGPTVEIGFNADYMLEFLRAVSDSEVAFLFKDANSAGEMRPAGEKAENYRYVIMPMRI